MRKSLEIIIIIPFIIASIAGIASIGLLSRRQRKQIKVRTQQQARQQLRQVQQQIPQQARRGLQQVQRAQQQAQQQDLQRDVQKAVRQIRQTEKYWGKICEQYSDIHITPEVFAFIASNDSLLPPFIGKSDEAAYFNIELLPRDRITLEPSSELIITNILRRGRLPLIPQSHDLNYANSAYQMLISMIIDNMNKLIIQIIENLDKIHMRTEDDVIRSGTDKIQTIYDLIGWIYDPENRLYEIYNDYFLNDFIRNILTKCIKTLYKVYEMNKIQPSRRRHQIKRNDEAQMGRVEGYLNTEVEDGVGTEFIEIYRHVVFIPPIRGRRG